MDRSVRAYQVYRSSDGVRSGDESARDAIVRGVDMAKLRQFVKSRPMSPISPALLALNNAHATELSELTAARLAELIGMAYMARIVGEADALLLAFDQAAAYDSPNYLWFRARYERFAYVDRVVVDPIHRGRGLARQLYNELFERARADGHTRVCCEVNIDPPNPVSDAFHAALGFVEAGRAVVGRKTLRYLSLPL